MLVLSLAVPALAHSAPECVSPPNLAAAVADAPAGATIRLCAGTYRTGTVKPKDGVTIVGAGRHKTIVDGSGAATVFEAGANVTLARMTVRGGTGTGACKPACGRGATFGPSGLVHHARFTDNDNQAIGGSAAGLVIRDSELDHNGSPDFDGCCGGGVKNVDGFVVIRTHVHDNIGNGVWCDRNCAPGKFVVRGSVIKNNTRNGIAYEVSGGPAVIKNNIIRGNNIEGAGDKGGLKLQASKNVEAFGNVFRDNRAHSIRVAGEPRDKPVESGGGYTPSNIYLHDNDLGGHAITGCNLPGVTCERNS